MKNSGLGFALGAWTLLCACSARSVDSGDESNPNDAPDGPFADALPGTELAPSSGNGGLDESWSCLAEEPTPFVLPDPPPEWVEYVFAVVDYSNPDPSSALANLTVQVCMINDFRCDVPIPALVDQPAPDVPAMLRIKLPFGLDGYLRLNAPGYVDVEYYFLAPMLGTPEGGAVVMGESLPLLRLELYEQILSQWGIARDPAAGWLMLRALDCRGNRARGVRLQLLNIRDAPLVPWVSARNMLVSDADPPATDVEGVAGFANVPPGVYSVDSIIPCVSPAACGTGEAKIVRSASAGFPVRANVITVGELRPDYSYGR